MAYTMLLTSSMMCINAKDTPTNDTDYNCYIKKAVELVYPIICDTYRATSY